MVASQVVQGESAMAKQASKYIDPGEKAQYIKEIARLKGELKSLQGEDRWDQIIRAKEENESLTVELERARDRLRTM